VAGVVDEKGMITNSAHMAASLGRSSPSNSSHLNLYENSYVQKRLPIVAWVFIRVFRCMRLLSSSVGDGFGRAVLYMGKGRRLNMRCQ